MRWLSSCPTQSYQQSIGFIWLYWTKRAQTPVKDTINSLLNY